MRQANAASCWDDIHWSMWRIAQRSDLLSIVHSARQVAREVVAPQLAAGARSSCEWTSEKACILASLDEKGLTSILSSARQGIATPLALAAWELAWVDGGAATLCLSGSLAQMPIRDFGTKEQQERYIGNAERMHGALCLTEPIPGAGTDAMFLSGRIDVAEWVPGSEPILEIDKRGRFISHMDFAEFVVVAVQGGGDSVRGGCLVILEPGDNGEFDRGLPVRKLGHRLASTTSPVFRLRVPGSRIVGGYTIEDGVVVPNLDHRQLLGPAFRRTRAVLSLMTASKLLSVVEPVVSAPCHTGDESALCERMADLWAAGEAAASLGFSAARLSDEVDRWANPTDKLTKQADVVCPAAKLFSTNSAMDMLPRWAALGGGGPMSSGPGGVYEKLMDAQVEAFYLGSEAVQRRLVSAAMIDGEFLREFQAWMDEMERLALRLPWIGMRSLTAGLRLWYWTLLQLRQQTDSLGAHLFCDARQGVTFPMADALCELLAARSLALDVLELEESSYPWAATDSLLSVLSDVSSIASVRAAGSVGKTCTALVLGYDGRFPVSTAARSAFDELRTKLFLSLTGTVTARDRVVRFLLRERAS